MCYENSTLSEPLSWNRNDHTTRRHVTTDARANHVTNHKTRNHKTKRHVTMNATKHVTGKKSTTDDRRTALPTVMNRPDTQPPNSPLGTPMHDFDHPRHLRGAPDHSQQGSTCNTATNQLLPRRRVTRRRPQDGPHVAKTSAASPNASDTTTTCSVAPRYLDQSPQDPLRIP